MVAISSSEISNFSIRKDGRHLNVPSLPGKYTMYRGRQHVKKQVYTTYSGQCWGVNAAFVYSVPSKILINMTCGIVESY